MKRLPGIFRTLLKGITQPFSEPCATLAYAETWHTRILEYSESFHNCILTHIQNPVKDLRFRFLQKIAKNYNYFSKTLYPILLTRLWISWSLNKYPLTCRVTSRYILIYCMIHIQNPLKDLRFRFLQKITKNYNYFSKALYLIPLTRFWISWSLNKYPLTCRVTSHYKLTYCMIHIQNPDYYRKFRHSGMFTYY